MAHQLFVPDEVLINFKNLFPEVPVGEVEWSWEVPNKIYEAEFELDGVDHEVEFFVTGDHLLTERSIELEELPMHIMAAVETALGEVSIESAEEVEYNNGLVVYELSLQKGENSFEVHVREDGKIVAKAEDL